MKNKHQTLKSLSSPKWEKKRWNKFGNDEAIFSCWGIPNNEKCLLLLILLFLLYNFLQNVFIKLKIQSRGQIGEVTVEYLQSCCLFALDIFLGWCVCGNRFCFFSFYRNVSTA